MKRRRIGGGEKEINKWRDGEYKVERRREG